MKTLRRLPVMLVALIVLPLAAVAATKEAATVEITFPTAFSYGKLHEMKLSSFHGNYFFCNKTPFAVARGTVQVPPGFNMVRLELSYAAAHHLDDLSHVGPALIALDAKVDNFDDDAFAKIGSLPNLRQLLISDCDITDKGIVNLGKLKHLQTLAADETEITGAGVMNTDWPPGLIFLNLSQNKLDDRCLQKVAGLKHLEHLMLNRTTIGDAGVKTLAQNTSIQELELASNNITDKAVSYLADMPKLKFLDITNTKVTGRCLADLAKISTLQTLRVDQQYMPATAVEKFKKALPHCVLDVLPPRFEPELFRQLH